MSNLTKTVASFTPNPIFMYNLNTVGYYDPTQVPFDNSRKYTYHELIVFCRHFYERDTIARTVINRMVNLAITRLRNRKGDLDETNVKFFDAVAKKLQPFLKHFATEYFIHGMAVPGITYKQTMMNRLDPALGRRRVEIPDAMWVRNPANIKLRKKPNGMDRAVFIEIPMDEVTFITQKGKRNDGTDDSAAYKELLRSNPAYVRAVVAGQRLFPIEEKALYADLVSYNDYPLPFLQNALRAMQHKEYLKLMDQTIVSRSIELLRQIKVGSDQFPATQDDIEATQRAITDAATSGDRVFNLFTNHTVEIKWVLPPLDALLNEAKYAEPNADVFLALGFPRILTVGESLRSNSSDSRIASLGPTATLTELRERILQWIEWLYEDLATRNNFSEWPQPYFSPIQFQDMTALTQFAIQAQQVGAISKDTIAQLYNTTYEEEQAKIQTEVQNEPTTSQPPSDGNNAPKEPDTPAGTGVQPPQGQ
jgi:hypothetical protein